MVKTEVVESTSSRMDCKADNANFSSVSAELFRTTIIMFVQSPPAFITHTHLLRTRWCIHH